MIIVRKIIFIALVRIVVGPGRNHWIQPLPAFARQIPCLVIYGPVELILRVRPVIFDGPADFHLVDGLSLDWPERIDGEASLGDRGSLVVRTEPPLIAKQKQDRGNAGWRSARQRSEELVAFRLGVIRKDQFQPSQQGGLGSSFERRLEIFGRLRTQLRRQQGEQFQSQCAMEGAKVPGKRDLSSQVNSRDSNPTA